MTNPAITGTKQSDVIRGLKHLLDMARSGRIVAIGYAVIQIDEDGSFVSGTNAVWTDDPSIKDAMKTAVTTLQERIDATTGLILQ